MSLRIVDWAPRRRCKLKTWKWKISAVDVELSYQPLRINRLFTYVDTHTVYFVVFAISSCVQCLSCGDRQDLHTPFENTLWCEREVEYSTVLPLSTHKRCRPGMLKTASLFMQVFYCFSCRGCLFAVILLARAPEYEERKSGSDGRYVPTHWAGSTTEHRNGHAVDAMLGREYETFCLFSNEMSCEGRSTKCGWDMELAPHEARLRST